MTKLSGPKNILENYCMSRINAFSIGKNGRRTLSTCTSQENVVKIDMALSAGQWLHTTFILGSCSTPACSQQMSKSSFVCATRWVWWINVGRMHGGMYISRAAEQHKESRKTCLAVLYCWFDWHTKRTACQLEIIPQVFSSELTCRRAWLWTEEETERCWLVWCPTDTPRCQRAIDCTQNAVGFLPRHTAHTHTHTHTHSSMHSEVDAHAQFCACLTHAHFHVQPSYRFSPGWYWGSVEVK